MGAIVFFGGIDDSSDQCYYEVNFNGKRLKGRNLKMRNTVKKMVSVFLALAVCASFVLPAAAEEISVTGKVTEVSKYGHAVLDITIEDFDEAGFALGDIVTVETGSYTDDLPYFNGYYVKPGDYLVNTNNDTGTIQVCINYGSFADENNVNPGDEVIITLKEKEGALNIQTANDMEYTNDREDYASDEVFANFRAAIDDKLYRSSSPADNQIGRASITDALVKEAGIQTIMDMADSDEKILEYFEEEDYDSPYFKELYEDGKVIPLSMNINFFSDDFAAGIVEGCEFLAENEPPYLVHCREGKDRTGFACALLEALMGWTEEEIVDDYMITFANYYNIEKGSENYNTIVEENITEMLRLIAGAEEGASLEGVDLHSAAESYLTDHGMPEESVKALEEKLS